jgi:oligopeptide/dipeptide ABC transporter ATP-binding protein
VALNGAAPPVLALDELVVDYPVTRSLSDVLRRRPARTVRAVDGVSISVGAGELVALVGESGCGKTTTGLAALGMVETSGGRTSFEGRDLGSLGSRGLRDLRRYMQMVYQDPYEALDPRFRVFETLEEPQRIHELATSSRAERRRRCTQALERVGLAPAELYLDRYPHELSGGQRQRVAIASSLVLNPRLLVADEPVSMLDVSVRAGVLELLHDLRNEGLAILMITHDLSTAAHYADRVAVMYLGRIVEQGPAKDVIREPKHPYTRALISVVPRRDPRRAVAKTVLRGEAPDATRIPPGCRFHPRCPAAEPRCSEHDPELAPPAGAAPGHDAACLLLPRADSVERV